MIQFPGSRSLGCKEAITLTTSRGGRNDSGEAVARQLGLTVHSYERAVTAKEHLADDKGFISSAQFEGPETDEFFAHHVHGSDMVFTPFEPHLNGAVLCTGFHGDQMWALGCPSGADIARGDASGSSMAEFRLRTGFVNLVVPFIGARHHEEIARISGSEEMAAFIVNWGGYHRPIPRRIAEEAGADRPSFGTIKMAAAAHISLAEGHFQRAFGRVVERYRAGLKDEPATEPAVFAQGAAG